MKDEQTQAIIGAAMKVHRELGCGFLEQVYQCALAVEFEKQGIPFQCEVQLPVHYSGIELDCSYRVDFICFNDVLVELKALSQLSGIEDGQVINYLKASSMKRALLINFGTKSLEFKRFVN
ncbi:GxxExxY protein [Verrucomicrobia bacterium S94]|nr:GxxExxY protein [Verrucomicrobia bacterium S94]